MDKDFVQIPNTKHYWINREGKVWTTYRNRFLATHLSKDGYERVGIYYLNGKSVTEQIHRLVANIFVPNPDNKPQVNHIDEDRTNNNASNLEWTTSSENNNHGNRNNRISLAQGIKVAKLDENDNIVEIYNSISKAAKANNCSTASLSDVCYGRVKKSRLGKYKFI